MNPNLTKFYCSNPDCTKELGEIACGSQLDDGSYCSSKCADIGKKGFISHEFEQLQKKHLELEHRHYLDTRERELMYEDIHQLRQERDVYKSAFELLVKELKKGE